MLKILRKKGVAKKILWAIAIVIILSFGFFGTTYVIQDIGKTSIAGRIFGKKIPLDRFHKAYRDVDLFARLHHGDNYYEVKEYLNLESDTWDRLILLHEAEKEKIKIPDDQVAASISQYPFFQRDGKFDDLLYNTILRSNFLRIQPRDFEEAIRDNLKIAELLAREMQSFKPGDKEIFDYYKKSAEKVQVSFALITSEAFINKTPTPSDDQSQIYYQEHQLDFLAPESIKATYLEFELPQTDDDAPKDAVRQKAIEVYSELRGEPSQWEETIKKHNLTAKTSNYFSRQSPDLSLGWSFETLNVVLAMNANEVSNPLENDTKILIVRIQEKKDAYVPTYDEIKDKVKEAIMAEEAKKIAGEKAQEYLQTIKQEYAGSTARDFSQIVKDLGLEFYQTPLFNRGLYLPKVGLSQEFQDAAFKLSPDNKISEIVETAKGFCILHFDNYQEADREEFKKAKEGLAKKLLDEKSGEHYRELLAQLRIQANLIDNLPKRQNQNEPAPQ